MSIKGARLLGCVLALALAWSPGCGSAEPAGEIIIVERQDLLLEVDVTGKLEAIDSDIIGPPAIPRVWQFKIASMVPEGSEVKQGDPVLAFDTTELSRQLERKQAERDSAAAQTETARAEGNIARADAHLELADAQAQRRKATLKTDVPEEIVAAYEMTKDRLDLELAGQRVSYLDEKRRDAERRRVAELEHWQHQFQRAEASVEQLGASIEKMSIAAPRDGTVVYETNWRGEKKSVGDSVWRMEQVLQIVSLDVMQGVGEVDEVDSSRIAVGQHVALHLDAQPDTLLEGTIISVSTMVRRQSPDNPLKVAELRIELVPNDKLRLRPGMRFRGKILIEKVEAALVVPLDAIVPTADGPMARRRISGGLGGSFGGGGFELVPVQTGRRNDTLIEIISGLEVGDELVRGVEPRA